MLYFIIPYLFQLACIIHIIKNRKSTLWLWIIIMIPYIGGIAYLIIELLPEIFASNELSKAKNSIVNIVKPNLKFEILEEKAKSSSTYTNMVNYADALMDKGRVEEALEIYRNQNRGSFLNDPDLLYRIAGALYSLEKYDEALENINSIFDKDESLNTHKKENILYLAIIGKIREPDFVKKEYTKILDKSYDNEIQLAYIRYLIAQKDSGELKNIFEKLHSDEKSLKYSNIWYDKAFYRSVYRLERELI